MLDAYLYGGLRSPFGRHGGALATVRPDDLAAMVIRELVARSGLDPAAIEDVVLGCAAQSGEDGRNVARHAALLAGLPPWVPGQTVNRLCGSGLAAVLDCARAVSAGEGDLYVAGGVESMTRAPFVVAKPEAAWARDFRVFDTTIGSRFPNPALVGRYGDDTMPQTADNVAAEHGISREAADRFAWPSQMKAAAAQEAGFFAGEILPIGVTAGRKAEPAEVSADEHPRPATTPESLAALKSLHGGVVTAGNASGINDGAAALLVMSEEKARALGLKPLVRIRATAVAGVDPAVMGTGPVPATQKALQRAGLALGDIDLIELNEAFAAQSLACIRLLKADESKINVRGGAIAIGHPLGASGARIATTLIHAMLDSDATLGLATMCIGIGQGIATIFERCS